MDAIVDGEGVVLVVSRPLFIHLQRAVRAAQALLLPILMDAPQVVHTVADGLLVAVLAKEVGCKREEGNVLRLQLENGCIKYGMVINENTYTYDFEG